MSNWVLRSWSEVLTIINGKNQKNVQDEKGEYPIYGSGGLMAYANDYLCNENTIVIGRKGTINSPIYVETKFWNVDTAFGISPGDELEPKFLYYFCLAYDFTKHNKSTTLPSLAKRDLLKIKMPVPSSLDKQKMIVSKLDTLIGKIDVAYNLIEENIKNSQDLWISLLDQEFSSLEKKFQKKPFGEIVKVINGRAYKKKEMLNSGKYPILRVGNFFSNRGWYYSDMELDDSKYCEKGDLLYAWSASFGPKIWDGPKSIYHYHIWKMVPLSGSISREYLYYLLDWDTEKIKEEGGRGVGMIHITKGGIEKRKMVLPPLDVQEKVSQKIKKFYKLHEALLNEQNEKLENLKALKKSLLDKAFKGQL